MRPFLVRSAVAFVVIGVALQLLVGGQVRDRYRAFAEFHAEFVARSLIEQQLQGQAVLGDAMGSDVRSSLTEFVRRFAIVGDVRQLSVWRLDGTIILAGDDERLGLRDAAMSPLLDDIVAQGPRTQRVDPGDLVGLDGVDDAIETYVPIEVDGRPAVVEVIQDLGPSLRAANAFAALTRRVILAVAPGRPVSCEVPAVDVDVDPAQVERIVEKLLVNALRHTPTDRAIEIAAEVGPTEVVLRVDDDGNGIPDELKERLLEPFSQGPLLHPETPGTGIGLALVDRFARLNGGSVVIRDTASGGASVRVTLPRTGAGPRDAAAATLGHDVGTR